jgi:hypothetical protein
VRRRDTGRVALATFDPLRTDDLDPGAADHTGWRGRWQCLGTIDDRRSPYFGQRLWWVLDDGPFFGWVPEADLVDLVD